MFPILESNFPQWRSSYQFALSLSFSAFFLTLEPSAGCHAHYTMLNGSLHFSEQCMLSVYLLSTETAIFRLCFNIFGSSTGFRGGVPCSLTVFIFLIFSCSRFCYGRNWNSSYRWHLRNDLHIVFVKPVATNQLLQRLACRILGWPFPLNTTKFLIKNTVYWKMLAAQKDSRLLSITWACVSDNFH